MGGWKPGSPQKENVGEELLLFQCLTPTPLFQTLPVVQLWMQRYKPPLEFTKLECRYHHGHNTETGLQQNTERDTGPQNSLCSATWSDLSQPDIVAIAAKVDSLFPGFTILESCMHLLDQVLVQVESWFKEQGREITQLNTIQSAAIKDNKAFTWTTELQEE